MEKIGEGLQYHVFLVDEDTVKKFPKSRDEMIETVKRWETCDENLEDLVSKGQSRRDKTVRKLKNSDLPLEQLFGITGFDSEKVFQKRMIPVAEAWRDKDFSEIVDDYLHLIEEMWRYGMGDTIYNFTINNGYRNGKIFQMDFGEVVFEKNRVKTEVADEKWLEKWSYNEDLDRCEKKVFRRKAEERLSVEKLERLWKTREN